MTLIIYSDHEVKSIVEHLDNTAAIISKYMDLCSI